MRLGLTKKILVAEEKIALFSQRYASAARDVCGMRGVGIEIEVEFGLPNRAMLVLSCRPHGRDFFFNTIRIEVFSHDAQTSVNMLLPTWVPRSICRGLPWNTLLPLLPLSPQSVLKRFHPRLS